MWNKHARIGNIMFEENSYMENMFHPELKDAKVNYISKKEYDELTRIRYLPHRAKQTFHPFSQLHLFIYQCVFGKNE